MESFKKFLVESKKKPKTHKMFIGFYHRLGPHTLDEKELTINRLMQIHGQHTMRHKDNSHTQHFNDNVRPQLTPDHHETIKYYSESGYNSINYTLYSGEKNPFPNIKTNINHLSDAISKSRVHRNFHVFSGMRSPEDYEPHSDNHIHIKNPDFTSASLNPLRASSFAKKSKWSKKENMSNDIGFTNYSYNEKQKKYNKNQKKYDYSNTENGNHNNSGYFVHYSHVAKIHVPKGAHGLYVEPITINAGEKEYIFHPGATFKFKKTPTIDHENKRVIWHGKLTHDGIEPTRHAKTSESNNTKNKKNGNIQKIYNKFKKT